MSWAFRVACQEMDNLNQNNVNNSASNPVQQYNQIPVNNPVPQNPPPQQQPQPQIPPELLNPPWNGDNSRREKN